nr:hypothetical protein [Tanacetum cinerariifolium]
MPILGTKELASLEQTAPDFSRILVKTQSSRYVVPTGRVIVPTDRYVVPTGKVLHAWIAFLDNKPTASLQKVAKICRFMNHMRDEAVTAKDCVAQLTALIAKLQAMEDQEEVHDSLLAAKDAKRDEQAKLVALNDVIAEALDEIETLKNNVEILDGTGDDV